MGKMPRSNYRKTFCMIDSPQRKNRKLETDIMYEVLNEPSTSSVSNIPSNIPALEVIENNSLTSSFDQDERDIDLNDEISTKSDSDQINFISSNEEENEFLPLFHQQNVSNNDEITDNNEDIKRTDFKTFLSSWAVRENIPQASLRILLRGIKQYTYDACHCNIPSDPRTLLHTPRSDNIRKCGNGEYCHFSLLKSIKTFVSASENATNIKISINIDGLPLSKSSHQQLWPILGSTAESKKVFIIGAYFGIQKPSNLEDFLREFVEETKLLCRERIITNNKYIQCSIDSIICDAPAKAFILQIKGHAGYSSCTKCITEGSLRGTTVCFPEINASLRTDLQFRSKTDENFHIGTSIIENIPNFDLTNNVPLDYMHLVCLGVTRRLLYLWLFGNKTRNHKDSKKFRLDNRKCEIVSLNLETKLKVHVPREFVRKP